MLNDPVVHREALDSASQLFLALQARHLAAEDYYTALQAFKRAVWLPKTLRMSRLHPSGRQKMLNDPALHREALASAYRLSS